MNFSKEMRVAEKAIKKSSNMLLEYFRQEKELVRQIIIETICKSFPDHNILAEETGNMNKKSDYLWLIDPLDGTLNFANGLPTWASMLAFQYKGEIVLSVISLPFLNDKRAEIKDGGEINGWIYFCGMSIYRNPAIKNLRQHLQHHKEHNDDRLCGRGRSFPVGQQD